MKKVNGAQLDKDVERIFGTIKEGEKLAKKAFEMAMEDMARLTRQLNDGAPETKAIMFEDNAFNAGIGTMFMAEMSPFFEAMWDDIPKKIPELEGNKNQIHFLVSMTLARYFKNLNDLMNGDK